MAGGEAAAEIDTECKTSPYQSGATSWLWCLSIISTKSFGQILDNLNVPLQASKAHFRIQIKDLSLKKNDEDELIWISDLAHDLWSIGKVALNAGRMFKDIGKLNARIAKFKNPVKTIDKKHKLVEELLGSMADSSLKRNSVMT